MQKADLMQLILAKTENNELVKLTAQAEKAETVYSDKIALSTDYLQLLSAAPAMFQQLEFTTMFLLELRNMAIRADNFELVVIIDSQIGCLNAAQRLALGESNQTNKMLN